MRGFDQDFMSNFLSVYINIEVLEAHASLDRNKKKKYKWLESK